MVCKMDDFVREGEQGTRIVHQARISFNGKSIVQTRMEGGYTFTLCRKPSMLGMEVFRISNTVGNRLSQPHDGCSNRGLRWCKADVEPWWEMLLHLVRTRQCLCRFLDITRQAGTDVERNSDVSRKGRYIDKVEDAFNNIGLQGSFDALGSKPEHTPTGPHICHWRLEGDGFDSVSTVLTETLSPCNSPGVTCARESETEATFLEPTPWYLGIHFQQGMGGSRACALSYFHSRGEKWRR